MYLIATKFRISHDSTAVVPCAAFYSDQFNANWMRLEGDFYRIRTTMENRSWNGTLVDHYDDVIMGTIASHITSLTSVYSTVYSGADQSKHQSSASLAFVWGIHRDRWIPRTKGQLRGKCFHLMTSSCCTNIFQGRLTDTGLIISPTHACPSASEITLMYVGK